MALDAAQLRQTRHEYVAALGNLPCNYTRPQLEQVATAIDDWCTANASSFNTALPAFFRNTASQSEKAAFLALVAMRRAGR